eukprot:4313510-Pyramimonas_sp.AAC.2
MFEIPSCDIFSHDDGFMMDDGGQPSAAAATADDDGYSDFATGPCYFEITRKFPRRILGKSAKNLLSD